MLTRTWQAIPGPAGVAAGSTPNGTGVASTSALRRRMISVRGIGSLGTLRR